MVSLYRCCVLSSLALSLLVMAPPAAHADDVIAQPKIDISRNNKQPVYPEGARDKKEQGDTVLAVYVETSGTPSKVNVETTSGFDDLDQAAVAAAQGWQFVPGTNNGTPVPAWTKVVIHFQASNALQHPNGDNEAYAATDDDNRIICKKDVAATGSHILPPPVCLTKREWDKATNTSKREVQRATSAGDTVKSH